MKTKYFYILVFFLACLNLQAQEEDEKNDESNQKGEQSRDSQAMDATATQWSFGSHNYIMYICY